MTDRTCSVSRCDREYYSRDLCKYHYAKGRSDGTLPLLPILTAHERLHAHLERRANGCLVWTGPTDPYGYGRIRIGGRKSPQKSAHRLAWELANGPLAPGVHLMHTCDNPPCCELSHLVPGDAAANMADRSNKGRHHNQRKTHCIHGHEFTPENTYARMTRTGRPGRECLTCKVNRRKKG